MQLIDGQVQQSEIIPVRRGSFAVDAINAIMSNPDRIGELQPEMIPALILKLAAIQGALAAQFLQAISSGKPGDVTEDADRLITVEKAASLLSLTQNYLYSLISKKLFPAIHIDGGRYIRIRLADLREWISRNSNNTLDNGIYATYSTQHDKSRTPRDKKKNGAYTERVRGPRRSHAEQHSETGTRGDRNTRATSQVDLDVG